MTSSAPRPREERPGADATPAIPAGVDGRTFLSDPVTDKLVQVVMELAAALSVERRRTRTLERVLIDAGVIVPDALEQWVDAPDVAAADREELDLWTKRIFRPLTQIEPAVRSDGDET